jgi:hypothetical protein
MCTRASQVRALGLRLSSSTWRNQKRGMAHTCRIWRGSVEFLAAVTDGANTSEGNIHDGRGVERRQKGKDDMGILEMGVSSGDSQSNWSLDLTLARKERASVVGRRKTRWYTVDTRQRIRCLFLEALIPDLDHVGQLVGCRPYRSLSTTSTSTDAAS